jgi:prophage regulatory protein
VAQNLFPYQALALKGIPYSKPTLWRKEKEGTFPRRVPIGAGRYAYVEGEIDSYIEQKIAERDGANSKSVAPSASMSALSS